MADIVRAEIRWSGERTIASCGECMVQTYLIERVFGHVDAGRIAASGSASKRVAVGEFSDSLVWRRSYASETSEGLVTYCLFESPDEATILAHAVAAGLPCTRVIPVNVVVPDDFD